MPLTAAFFGATTLLIDDGETRLLTDGFFTRPGLLRVLLGRIAPRPALIASNLARAGITRLDAVLVGHSHYDHAMDAPEVCRLSRARLYGSSSTANIARGWRLPEEQICPIQPGKALPVGRFKVTFYPSRHAVPLHYPGAIHTPLIPPARASAYREGGTFAILIEHPLGSLLVHESAAYLPGELSGVRADTAFISIASLSQRPEEREAYFREVVLAVGAKLVCPIHHDDFFQALRPHPRLVPGARGVLDWLARRVARQPGLKITILEPWQSIVLPGGSGDAPHG